jgi:Tfp pilus assembly protein PilO
MKMLREQVSWCARAQWVMGICALVLLAGFYVVGYLPASRRLAQLDRQIANTRDELTNTRGKANSLQVITRDVQKLKEKLENSKKLPSQNDLPQFITDVELFSRKSSLRGYSSNVLKPVRNDTFWQMPIELKFEGDFSNVFTFLQQTEAQKRLTRVKKIELKAKDREPGQVAVQLTMNIYYLTE